MTISQIANYVLPSRWRRVARFAWVRTAGLLRHGDPWYFSSASIQTSGACNRRCVYCPVSVAPYAQEYITDEQLDVILHRLAECNFRGPCDVIFYNEPLLNTKLEHIVRRMVEKVPGIQPMVTTNGDKLTPKLARELIAAGVVQFVVTRHPPYKDAWDENMREVRREFPGHIHFMKSPGDEGWTNRGGLVEIPGPNAVTRKTGCASPEALSILMNGDVLLCCNDYKKEHVMGNLKHERLVDIYYKPDFVQLRKDLRRGKPRLDICVQCMDGTAG